MIAGARLVVAGLLALLVVFLGGGGVASATTSMLIQLSPASIVADGTSTTTVTATGAGGLLSDPTFSAPYDKDIVFGPTHPNGDGTFSATLTSSHRAETTLIYGSDPTGPTVTPATLTQLSPSSTSLTVASNGPLTSASTPVTNQGVTLLSTVTTSAVAPTGAAVPPSGTVEFENAGTPISGCGAVQIPTQTTALVNVTCTTSFAAPSSPAQLTAVFSPTPGSLIQGSASQPEAFSIYKDSTSTTVTTPDSTPNVDAPVTYTAVIAPGHAGSLSPRGQVAFADGGRVISSCASQPVDSSATATCTVKYTTAGHHTITASYGGDDSFSGSSSPAIAIGVQPLGTITATMQWTFYYTPSYTRVRQLIVNGLAPA